MTERKENPMKKAAVDLVHMMDYQKSMQYENDFKRELFREEWNEFTMDLVKKGFDFNTLLFLGEQYKKLTMAEYREWMCN